MKNLQEYSLKQAHCYCCTIQSNSSLIKHFSSLMLDIRKMYDITDSCEWNVVSILGKEI